MGGVECATLSGQLEEAKQELSRYKGLVSAMQVQEEEYKLERDELKAELELMHAKVQRLERSTRKEPEVEREDKGGSVEAEPPIVSEVLPTQREGTGTSTKATHLCVKYREF